MFSITCERVSLKLCGNKGFSGYIIDSIRVRSAVLGAAGAASGLGAEGGGGQIHGPEHQQGGVRVDALGGENAVDLGLVPGKVARGLGDAEAEDEGAATGAGQLWRRAWASR